MLEAFNLFDAEVSDIDYFYASRLPGEPEGGGKTSISIRRCRDPRASVFSSRSEDDLERHAAAQIGQHRHTLYASTVPEIVPASARNRTSGANASQLA